MTGWRHILSAAALENERFRSSLATPAATQKRILSEVLRDNASTEFGAAHGISKTASIRDFQSAVPVSGYPDFRSWIERALDGAPNVLTTAPIVACEETGGTSGGAKLVPYTQKSLDAFRAAILPSLFDLAQRRPAMARGKIYAAISPASRQPRKTTGGMPIGLASDAAYLGDDLIPAFGSLLAVSPAVSSIADVNEWRKTTVDQLSACASLSFVSVWSPTFWLELIGDLDFCALWPQLDTISCWTDGPSGLFAKLLRSRFPGVHIEPKGLLSTESPVTLAYGDEEGCLPALNSAFLEFLDGSENTFLVDELCAGEEYRVVITTAGGLYRYDTQDIVRCLSISGGVPRLAFLGRAGNVSDMVGEKLDEAFVAGSLQTLPVAARLVARAEPKPHYELWLEEPVSDASRVVDQRLRQNPQYDYARKVGQLGDVAAVTRPEFWSSFSSGKRLGVMKPSVLQRLQVLQS
jgi:GH3 auxin-responsive promoter